MTNADPTTLSCPICGGRARPFTDKAAFDTRWQIARCGGCGHGFVVNRPTPARLRTIYETWHDDATAGASAASLEANRDAADLASAIVRHRPARPGDRALDVGAGGGAFSFHLSRRGFDPMLIDWDPRGRRLTPLIPRSTFRACSLEDLVPASGGGGGGGSDGPFAVILMSQVLEHALDPLDWLQRSRRLLQPDGLLAVALPNFGGVFRVLGRRDPFLIPPVHLNFFTPRSLRHALTQTGFRAVSLASRSGVTLTPPGRRLPMTSRLVRSAWNGLCPVINPTPWGIILWSLAKPA